METFFTHALYKLSWLRAEHIYYLYGLNSSYSYSCIPLHEDDSGEKWEIRTRISCKAHTYMYIPYQWSDHCSVRTSIELSLAWGTCYRSRIKPCFINKKVQVHLHVCMYLCGIAHCYRWSNWAKGRDPSESWVQCPNPAAPLMPRHLRWIILTHFNMRFLRQLYFR